MTQSIGLYDVITHYLGVTRTTVSFAERTPHKSEVTDQYQGSCSVHLLLKLPFHQSPRVLLKEYPAI